MSDFPYYPVAKNNKFEKPKRNINFSAVYANVVRHSHFLFQDHGNTSREVSYCPECLHDRPSQNVIPY